MNALCAILKEMGYGQPTSVIPFLDAEDGSPYSVWLVTYPDATYVLKKAKGAEKAIYARYFCNSLQFAPRLVASMGEYLLLEYIPGEDLMVCTREKLTLALDALVQMLEHFGEEKAADIPENRYNRRKYLMDPGLEAAYDAYLAAFFDMPAFFCHDDLLPFNVRINEDRAVLIDWEVAGVLPYPTAFARLIAHTDEDENAFFYMSNADKTFAIDYFYQHFARKHNIPYETYLYHLDLCLLYEYCEWVYVGNRYGNTDNDRYRKYRKMALLQAEKLGFNQIDG